MGKYKAGDRVKILAGHPYFIGNNDAGVETEGVYVTKEDRGWRGKHHVLVEEVGGDGATELPFKGREIELIVDEPTTEEAWVPKVGDRVRLLEDNCDVADWGKAGEAGTVISVSVDSTDAYVDFDVSGKWHAQFHSMEPVAAEAQPTVEAPAGLWSPVVGKYGKTRSGGKVGPIGLSDDPDWPYRDTSSYGGAYYNADGSCPYIPGDDLVAEWVDEPVVVAEATATPAYEVGQRVRCIREYPGTFTVGKEYTVAYFDAYEPRLGVTAADHGGADGIGASYFEPAAPPAKFKVGDRVKIVSNSRGQDFRESDVGKTMTVTTVFEDGSCGGEESSWWWPAADLELVNSAKPANDNHEVILTVDSPEKANLLRAYADLLNAA